MSGRKRRSRFRRRTRRRNNVGIIISISAIIVAVLVISLLIIGNILHDRSEADANNGTFDSSEQQVSTNEIKAPTRSIKGYPVMLEASDSSTLADRLDRLVTNNTLEASIPLNTKEGIMLYDSVTAKKLGISVGASNVRIEDVTATAKERGIYLCGVYYVNAFSMEDDLLRSVELSKSAAVISEALRAGFDEVLMIAPHMSAESENEAVGLMKSIRSLSANGLVGLSVPKSIFELEDSIQSSELISILNESFDFLAIDMSDIVGSDAPAQISERINAEKLHLHMYKMRVLLLAVSDSSTQDQLIASVEGNGVSNWQILKY